MRGSMSHTGSDFLRTARGFHRSSGGMTNMKIVIIGNSAAGTAAIETIRTQDTESSIVQISDETSPLYSRCLLSYYLAGKIDKNGISYRSADFHKTMDVQLNQGSHVTEVDPAGQKVTCLDGRTHSFDKLLIATGSSAKIPDNIPKTLGGVFVRSRVLVAVDRVALAAEADGDLAIAPRGGQDLVQPRVAQVVGPASADPADDAHQLVGPHFERVDIRGRV